MSAERRSEHARTVTNDRRWPDTLLVGAGVVGFLLAFALDADVALESGLWYPVIYAGAPAVGAPAALARAQPDVSLPELVAVGAWILVSSVLALAAAVVLSLGFGPQTAPSPAVASLFILGLYVGFFLLPVGASTIAARRDDYWGTVPLALSPVAQVALAAVLAVLV